MPDARGVPARLIREKSLEPAGLLDLDFGSGVLELLRELIGLFLRNARLDRLAALVHEVLRLLEAQARGRADHLDDVDLVRAGALEDDVERRLLFLRSRRRRRRGAAAATAARRRLHAELLFEGLDGRRKPQNVLLRHELGKERRALLIRQLARLVHQTRNVAHDRLRLVLQRFKRYFLSLSATAWSVPTKLLGISFSVETNCTVTAFRRPRSWDSNSCRPGSFDSCSIWAGVIGFPSIRAALTAPF